MKPSGEQELESAMMPHVNALFQTALQLMEDRAAAEDLVIEVCGYARDSFKRCKKPAEWRPALLKILIQRARRRSPDRTVQGLVLSGVPRTEREIILLVDCLGFSYQQAADILGVSRDAVAQGIGLGRTYLETAARNCCEAHQ